MASRLHWLASASMGIAFSCMIVASFLQIVTRYIFRAPLLGAEELARLFGVWLYFLGAACGLIAREHIAIDIVYSRVPARVQRLFRLVSDVLLFVFNAFLLVEGTKFAVFSYNFESSSLRFSMSFFAGALPLSAALSLVFLACAIWNGIWDDTPPVG